MQPVAGKDLGVFLGPVQVAFHHQRTAHAQLADLARRDFTQVGVEQLDLVARDHLAARAQAFGVVRIVVALAQVADAHRHFSLAVDLPEHRADAAQRVSQAHRRDRRRAVEHQFQAGQVGRVQPVAIEQAIDLRGDQEGQVDPLFGHAAQEIGGTELVAQVNGAATQQRRQEQAAGRVRDRRGHQVADLLRPFVAGQHVLQHRYRGPVRMQDALGAAGGAAGIGQPADFRGVVARDHGRAIERSRRTGQARPELAIVKRQDLQAGAGRQHARPLGEAGVVHHQRPHPGILQHEGVIRFRGHRMQRHVLQPGQLRGDDGGDRFGAVAHQEGHGILARQPAGGKQPRDARALQRERLIAQRGVVADDGGHAGPGAQRGRVELAHRCAAVDHRSGRSLTGHVVSSDLFLSGLPM
ncbi:hypothetical protein D9M72_263780 [compost metagenome]